MKKLSVITAIQTGWQKTKEQLGFWIPLTLLCAIIFYIIFRFKVNDDLSTFLLIIGLIVVEIMWIKNILSQYNNGPLEYWRRLNIYEFLNYLILRVLVEILVIIGLIFLIIPGIVISIRLSMAPFLLIDKKMNPIDAIKKSWEITKGYGLEIFAYRIVSIFIILSGIICLLVGLLIAVPVVQLGNGYIYNLLTSESESSISEN